MNNNNLIDVYIEPNQHLLIFNIYTLHTQDSLIIKRNFFKFNLLRVV